MANERAGADTFPKLLIQNAETRGTRVSMRHKDLGIWQSWTWGQILDEVRAFSVGLEELGLKRGDKFAVIGANRPRLYWAMCAGQAIGAVPVPIYADSVADEMAYVLEHAEVTVAVVQDQEQVDKVISIAERVPALRHLVYDEPRGLRDYDRGKLSWMDDVQKVGREKLADPARLARWQESIAQGQGADLGVILYTSGTTGRPKGVMLSYDNMIVSARNGNLFDKLDENEETIAYLPLAWVGDHLFSYAQHYVAGYCVNCPEAGETVIDDRREVGTTYAFAPPRVFENLLTLTMVRMEDAGRLKRKMFHFFIDHARKYGEKLLNKEPVPLTARLIYSVGDVLVYGPLKNRFGLTNIRVGYTAGEAIGPEIFRFYRSIGVNLKQLYGQTEASVYITAQPDGEIYADTVGKPNIDVDLKIAELGRGAVQIARCLPRLLQGPGEDRRDQDAGRLGAHRRCRLHRSEDRASEDHRPRQGCRAAQGRHAVCAEVHREQAQVLSEHQGSGRAGQRTRRRHRDAQHRSHRGRLVGGAQQCCLWLLSGAGGSSARL